jgi:hypothetical protein
MLKRALFPLALVLAFLAVAQQLPLPQPPPQQRPRPSSNHKDYPEWEVKELHPHEVAAGRYIQVRPYELDNMAAEGWELVSVTTYVLRNEEHEGLKGERPIVTQAYLSYAFKRLKRDPLR